MVRRVGGLGEHSARPLRAKKRHSHEHGERKRDCLVYIYRETRQRRDRVFGFGACGVCFLTNHGQLVAAFLCGK